MGPIGVFREIRKRDPDIPLVLEEEIRTKAFLTEEIGPGLPREFAGIMVPPAALEHS